MSYINEQPKNYPTIIELIVKEKEILQLLSDYKIEHDTLTKQIQQNPSDSSNKKMISNLQNKNDVIVSKLNKLKNMMSEVYPKGIENDSLTNIINNEELVELSAQLNSENNKMSNLIKEYNSYNSENEVLVLNEQSYFMQYLVFIIVSIILIYLTIKAYSSNNVSNIENLILMIVIMLIIYYIWFKWSRGNLFSKGI